MRRQRRLVIFSGAGLSADSGLQTFRGCDGTWAGHDVRRVCNIYSFKANFDLVHAFYNARRAEVAAAEPNAMHRMLVDWQRRFGAELITQNIDDLLERAGATDVMHVHGSLTGQQCRACGRSWEIGLRSWDIGAERCGCGSRKGVKPKVVFFGETAPLYGPMRKALETLSADDMLVVIGTDGAVVPIGAIASRLSCRKILNNLSPVAPERWSPGMVTPAGFDHAFFAPAASVAGEIDRIVSDWMSAPLLAPAN